MPDEGLPPVEEVDLLLQHPDGSPKTLEELQATILELQRQRPSMVKAKRTSKGPGAPREPKTPSVVVDI